MRWQHPVDQGTVLVNPLGPTRLRAQPIVLATTIRWLECRDDDAWAALLRRVAAVGPQLARVQVQQPL